MLHQLHAIVTAGYRPGDCLHLEQHCVQSIHLITLRLSAAFQLPESEVRGEGWDARGRWAPEPREESSPRAKSSTLISGLHTRAPQPDPARGVSPDAGMISFEHQSASTWAGRLSEGGEGEGEEEGEGEGARARERERQRESAVTVVWPYTARSADPSQSSSGFLKVCASTKCTLIVFFVFL